MAAEKTVDVLIENIGMLVTMQGPKHPRRGKEMQSIGLIDNGAIAISEGKIVAVGDQDTVMELIQSLPIQESVDAQGCLVTPGLVDPHTHLVFGGSREDEIPLKLENVPYLEILKRGGGILSTVKATRESSFDTLYNKANRILDQMLALGTTTVEAKSGYGLNWETEQKQLQVVQKLQQTHDMSIVSTFMGAHAVPPAYQADPELYVKQVIEEMLPQVQAEGLAAFCDIFCEEGVFDVEQSRRILLKAKELGFGLKIHADEIHAIGGSELAAELQATSAEHLVGATDEGIELMAKAGTIAVLLPGTTFYLRSESHARARTMISKELPVALSTDYNPGSSPLVSMQFVMTLAYLHYRMTPEEIITAVTTNAAYAIGKGEQVGRIESGMDADIVLWNAPNLAYIPYHYGYNHVDSVWKKGKQVVRNGSLIEKAE